MRHLDRVNGDCLADKDIVDKQWEREVKRVYHMLNNLLPNIVQAFNPSADEILCAYVYDYFTVV